MKLVLLTPNADPTLDLGQELAAYASMLAPEVVRKARSLVREGADAVVIDCMSEPGLGEAQRSVPIPVIGPRSAVLAAAGGGPVTFVRDEAAARRALAEGARVLSLSS